MKKYNKPTLIIEDINIEDVILSSFAPKDKNEVIVKFDFGEKVL